MFGNLFLSIKTQSHADFNILVKKEQILGTRKILVENEQIFLGKNLGKFRQKRCFWALKKFWTKKQLHIGLCITNIFSIWDQDFHRDHRTGSPPGQFFNHDPFCSVFIDVLERRIDA